MSYKCSVCGKSPHAGNTISHSHRATKRIFKPNLQRLRIIRQGKTVRAYVCTTCIKSGNVRKAV